MSHRILAISGSRRLESLNRRLLSDAARILRQSGAVVDILDWDRFDLPIYDGDLESQCGTPAPAVRLKRLIAGSDGLVIATPEYNGSLTPLLKNAIDWASRPGAPEKVFRDRPVALLGASPGPSGGARGLRHLRGVLDNLGARVLDREFALAKAMKAHDPDTGVLKPELRESLVAVTGALLEAIGDAGRLTTQRRA